MRLARQLLRLIPCMEGGAVADYESRETLRNSLDRKDSFPQRT